MFLLAEGLGRRRKDRHLGDARGVGPVEARQVRHERGVAHSGPPADAGEHLGRVRHLRNPFRTDKRRHLDDGETRGRQPIDEADLVRGRNRSALVLESIPRTHFDDADSCRPRHSPISMSVRPGWTSSPSRQWTARDDSRAVCPDGQFHLHGFEDDERIAALDRVADADEHAPHGRRHRCRQRAVVSGAGARERPRLGELEHAPVDEHPADVADGDGPRRHARTSPLGCDAHRPATVGSHGVETIVDARAARLVAPGDRDAILPVVVWRVGPVGRVGRHERDGSIWHRAIVPSGAALTTGRGQSPPGRRPNALPARSRTPRRRAPRLVSRPVA